MDVCHATTDEAQDHIMVQSTASVCYPSCVYPSTSGDEYQVTCEGMVSPVQTCESPRCMYGSADERCSSMSHCLSLETMVSPSGSAEYDEFAKSVSAYCLGAVLYTEVSLD